MEPKIWIYIIVAVIYIVRWAMKRASQKPTDVPDSQRPVQRYDSVPTVSSEKPRPLTFEELLKEITESKQTSQPQPTYVDYDDDIEEEIKDLEIVPQQKASAPRVYEEYETSKQEAFNRPSLEETLKLADTNVGFGKFKAFKLEDNRNVILEDYVREFRDPDGFKKAVVMSEILKTKF